MGKHEPYFQGVCKKSCKLTINMVIMTVMKLIRKVSELLILLRIIGKAVQKRKGLN